MARRSEGRGEELGGQCYIWYMGRAFLSSWVRVRVRVRARAMAREQGVDDEAEYNESRLDPKPSPLTRYPPPPACEPLTLALTLSSETRLYTQFQ